MELDPGGLATSSYWHQFSSSGSSHVPDLVLICQFVRRLVGLFRAFGGMPKQSQLSCPKGVGLRRHLCTACWKTAGWRRLDACKRGTASPVSPAALEPKRALLRPYILTDICIPAFAERHPREHPSSAMAATRPPDGPVHHILRLPNRSNSRANVPHQPAGGVSRAFGKKSKTLT